MHYCAVTLTCCVLPGSDGVNEAVGGGQSDRKPPNVALIDANTRL